MAVTKVEPWTDDGETVRVERTVELVDEPALDRQGAGFAVGSTLGRFVVRRIIGEGGMGVVLEAYDADLDRAVAIKVVRDRSSGSHAGQRLLVEAQAMARLAHPNVVAIYEVGTAAGQVFLVMELVSGQTLGEWLRSAPRGWREIVGALVHSGEGLHAAHRTGLVHRDFKPSNVLLDGRGRVLVTDFGIAHLAAEIGEEAAGRSALASATPRPGARIGTPGYMAPEQSRGEAVDARADQYAFGITLRDALRDLAGTPPRVRRAIARATSDDPAARFPSMVELVTELRQVGNRRRRAMIAVAAASGMLIGGAAAGGLVLRNVATPIETCNDGVSLVDRVWSGEARSALASAFAASGRPYAASSTSVVGEILDDYAGAWRLGRRAACQADAETRVRRLACLDRRLGSLRAQLRVWSGEVEALDAVRRARLVDGAVDGAARLPSIDGCLDAPASATEAALAPLLSSLDDASARHRAGQSAALRADVSRIVAEAEAAGDPGTLADALQLAGHVALDTSDFDAARDLHARAAREAARAGDDRVMALALIDQATATAEARPGDALGLIDAAGAVLVRVGITDLDTLITLRRGEALARAGRSDAAIAELERAVALAETDAAGDAARIRRLTLSAALVVLANANANAGRYQEALPLHRRSLAIEEELRSPDHPEIAASLHDLAVTEARVGLVDDARAHYERARGIAVAAYGPEHALVGTIEASLGGLELEAGELERARAHDEEARRILERALPVDHPTLAVLYGALGAIERELDRCEAAMPLYRHAAEIFTRAGVGGRRVAISLTGLGACLHDLERWSEARPPLERALAELDSEAVPAVHRVEVRANLADVLWYLGERDVAVAMAREANADLPADEPAAAPLREHFRLWFAERKLAPR